MYTKGFFINGNFGNNSFNLEKRKNKKIFVPEIIDLDLKDLDKIEIQNDKEKIAFEEIDEFGVLNTNYGLKNFYRIPYFGKEIILFDNHNHAFYFWFEVRKNGIIKDGNDLFHIDWHSDMKDDLDYLLKPKSLDLKNIFDFTNFSLNVGNYIVPALKEGIIKKVFQIRNETNLLDFLSGKYNFGENFILNLDLDFFHKDLDFVDFNLKKQVILELSKNAKLITVSTSPFFIDQNLAIKIFKEIFSIEK